MDTLIRMVFEKALSLRADRTQNLQMSAALDGFISGLFFADAINKDEFSLLNKIAHSAFIYSGDPFPSHRNAGPVMPIWISYARTHESVKPQAEVPPDAPAQVSEPAARRKLRLLCVLDNARDGEAPRYLPVHTLRPMPPRVSAQGRWSLGHNSGFYLRETHAKPASAALLARGFQHGQTHAIRADSRTIRA